MGLFLKKSTKPKSNGVAPAERLLIFWAHYNSINHMYLADTMEELERHPNFMKVKEKMWELEERFEKMRAGSTDRFSQRSQNISAIESPLLCTWNPMGTRYILPQLWCKEILSHSPKDTMSIYGKLDTFMGTSYLNGATEEEREFFYEKAGSSLEVIFNPESKKMMEAYSEELNTAFFLVLTPNVRPQQLPDGSWY